MIDPHGGTLRRALLDDNAFAPLAEAAGGSIILTHDDVINLGNLAAGVYSPLAGFMGEDECWGVMKDMKLPSGPSWCVPILLHGNESLTAVPAIGGTLALKDAGARIAGLMDVQSVFEIEPKYYANRIFGTDDAGHPGVRNLFNKSRLCLGGPVFAAASALPKFRHHQTPEQLRARLASSSAKSATAFATRNIAHIGHQYQQTRALEENGVLGINVITGAEIKGNFLPDVIFETYEYLAGAVYPEGMCFLNNLRLPPLYGGPKEAFLQATMMQNYGFTHFVVGRDHAGVGDYYGKYDSQDIFGDVGGLAISILKYDEPYYCGTCDAISRNPACPTCGEKSVTLNGRDVRRAIVEKRFNDLKLILSPEMQTVLIEISEVGLDEDSGTSGKALSRKLFYD